MNSASCSLTLLFMFMFMSWDQQTDKKAYGQNHGCKLATQSNLGTVKHKLQQASNWMHPAVHSGAQFALLLVAFVCLACLFLGLSCELSTGHFLALTVVTSQAYIKGQQEQQDK